MCGPFLRSCEATAPAAQQAISRLPPPAPPRPGRRQKSGALLSVPKLEDANWAGGPRASECTLILTEGDSAKALAVAGEADAGCG